MAIEKINVNFYWDGLSLKNYGNIHGLGTSTGQVFANTGSSNVTQGGVLVGGGQVGSDIGIPLVPQNLALSSVEPGDLYIGRGDNQVAKINVSWQQVTRNVNGSVVNDPGSYELRWKRTSDTEYHFPRMDWVPGVNPTMTLLELEVGTSYDVGVQAIDQYGNPSGFSDDETQVTASDTTAPSQPAVPGAVQNKLWIDITHDLTKEGGGNLEDDTAVIQIHYGTTAGFTPDTTPPSTTLIADISVNASMLGDSIFYRFEPPDKTEYFYKVVAYDFAGNESAASDASAGVSADYMTATEMATDFINNSNVQDLIADGTFDNSVTANLFAANAILAKHIIVADFHNLIQDSNWDEPIIEDSNASFHYFLSGGGAWTREVEGTDNVPYLKYDYTSQASSAYLHFNGTNNPASGIVIAHPPTRDGEGFELSVQMRYSGVAPDAGSIYLRGRSLDKDGTGSAWENGADFRTSLTTSWQEFTHTMTVNQTDAMVFRAGVALGVQTTAGAIEIRNARIRRRVAGSLIVDGGVHASHIDIDDEITVGPFAMGLDVGGTLNDGIWLDGNNYWWQLDGEGGFDFEVGDGATKSLFWDSSAGTLDVRGSLNADDITAGLFTAGNAKLGHNADGGTGDGLYFDANNYFLDDSGFKFKAGSAGSYVLWNGSTLSVKGTVDATAGSLASLDVTGDLTITGSGTIKSAGSGNRVEIPPGNDINFYASAGLASQIGVDGAGDFFINSDQASGGKLTFTADNNSGGVVIGQSGTLSDGYKIFSVEGVGTIGQFTYDFGGSGQIEMDNGVVGNPSYSFIGDRDTGMYSRAANELNWATAGGERMRLDSSGYLHLGQPRLYLDSFTDAGDYIELSETGNSFKIFIDTTERLRLAGDDLSVKGRITIASVTSASYWEYAGGYHKMGLTSTDWISFTASEMNWAQTNFYATSMADNISSGERVLRKKDSDGRIGGTSSTARVKEDINPLMPGDPVIGLNPVSFRYRKTFSDDNRVQLGFIAEEVEKVWPAATARDKQGRPDYVGMDNLVVPLVLSSQHHSSAIADLRQRIEELEIGRKDG